MFWVRCAVLSFSLVAFLFTGSAWSLESANEEISALKRQAAELHAQGNDKEATAAAWKAVILSETAYGGDHPVTLENLFDLVALYTAQGLFGDARHVQNRAVAISERLLGPDHPRTLSSIQRLAELNLADGDGAAAFEMWRRSTAATARAVRGDMSESGDEPERASRQFEALIKTAYRLTPSGGMPNAALARDMFEAAQWVQLMEGARSAARIAAGLAAANPALAALARERGELIAARQALDDSRLAPNRGPDAAIAARVDEILVRTKAVNQELAAKFPEYARLIIPAPIPLEDVQTLIGEDEALVLFLDTAALDALPEESFIWIVTRDASRWVRSGVGAQSLGEEVQALRCGLDRAAQGALHCTDQASAAQEGETGKRPRFDMERAHRLYEDLFSQVEDLIRGKNLIISPSGPLRQLPFQALLTAAPVSGTPPAWLIRDHSITIAPLVSSLKAIHNPPAASAPAKPMIGFGAPLPNDAVGAAAKGERPAGAFTICPPAPPAASAVETPKAIKSGALAAEAPPSNPPGSGFPDANVELCAFARSLHVEAADIYLGKRATAQTVKRLNRNGELRKYRIVQFAARPVVPTSPDIRSGLAMTSPDASGGGENGLLDLADIASLKLDANWVILSAVNTADGGARGADSQTELMRAFLYAGASAVVVSQWQAPPEAAAALLADAWSRFAAGGLSAAGALRQAMLEQIDHGTTETSHPSLWAAFMVAGEHRIRR